MRRCLPLLCTFLLCLVPCLCVTGLAAWLLMWYPDLVAPCIFAVIPLLAAAVMTGWLVQWDRQNLLEEQVRSLEKRIEELNAQLQDKNDRN